MKYGRRRSLKTLALCLTLIALLILPFQLAACGPDLSGIPNRITQDEDKIADFSVGASDKFRTADGYSNGWPFNCTWRDSSVTFDGGVMRLTIDKDIKKEGGISSGEYRSKGSYGYGYFSVCMKPPVIPGVVTSFFTYTGESENNPHDEIDFEFLGKDTTKVQLNYYSGGKGGHEYIFNLGFDAAADFHEYGFEWQPDKIIWYVDGRPVYAADKDIPTTPGKIMMNLWNGSGDTMDGWAGTFDVSDLPASAEYKWVAYSQALTPDK